MGRDTTRSRSVLQDVLIYTPVLVCILVMLPRLASPQFGLLDDGWNLGIAREVANGNWQASLDAQAVRFRPLYWLLPGLIYRLVGAQPLWYFCYGLLLFASATACLIAVVRAEGGSRLQAWLSGVLFALSGPTIEAYYTLPKSESMQVAWLAASLLPVTGISRQRSRLKRTVCVGASAFFLLLAYFSKETTLVMLPIAGAWLLVAWFARRGQAEHDRVPDRKAYLVANAVCLPLILLLAYRFFLPSEVGLYVHNYGSALQGLLASLVRWAGWLLRDFPYLLPLGLYFGISLLRARGRWPSPLVLEGLAWMIGWVGVFLPWGFTDEYYLLPCAIGCAMFSASVLERAIREVASRNRGQRWLARGSLAAAVLGLALTLPNNLTTARIQLTVDAVNAEALASIAAELRANSTLIVCLPAAREYYDEIRIHLTQLLARPDLTIRSSVDDPSLAGLPAEGTRFLLVPYIQGRPYFGVRVGIGEEDAQTAEAFVRQDAGAEVLPVREFIRGFTRTNINLPALLCPLVGRSVYCSQPRDAFESESFIYGWRLLSLGNR